MDRDGMIQTRIRSVSWEATDILRYFLEPVAGEKLPAFTAGAHINVSVADGLARSYSLLNDPEERDRYEIAVQLDARSRGGSKRIHEQWRPGQLVDVSTPANNFPLDESAQYSVLIAGGIGITPMLSMVARLNRLGRPWELHYACRSEDRVAFMTRLQNHPQVHLHIDSESARGRLDLEELINGASDDTHFYCCGPQGMLEAYQQLTGHLGERAHCEFFSADTEVATDGGYSLELVRSGKQINVQPGVTMLDALLDAGVNVGYACSEGICGTCRVQVVAGIPDHRDHFLTAAEKSENRSVMVCCSGAKTKTLSLDL